MCQQAPRVTGVPDVGLAELRRQRRFLARNSSDEADGRQYEARCQAQDVPQPESNASEHEDCARVRRMPEVLIGPVDYDW